MWISFSIASALLLGMYDFFKKVSLKKNSVMWSLFMISVLSTVLLGPFFRIGPLNDLLQLVPKAALVTVSWISGLAAMKVLPLTTASTLKASRPIFVVMFSVLLFGERLSVWQWTGVVTVIFALFLLSLSSKKEGITFIKSKGVAWMMISIATGAASAIYDKRVVSCLNMEPMFVQCWSNFIITLMMGIVLLVRRRKGKKEAAGAESFRWDWCLLAAAVLIVSADAFYFYSLSFEGSMLSIISLIRRSCVIVTFIMSAWLLKEHNIRSKGIALVILLAGVSLLALSS